MTTRRERLAAKLEKREDWAVKAESRAEARFKAVREVADRIPFGQPILVGHHSERHARRDAERIRSGMDKAVELSKLADHHEAKARGIAAQLDRSIFSDDENAVTALEARIAEREAQLARRKAINAAFKGAPGIDRPAKLAALVKAGTITGDEAVGFARFFGQCHWEERPFPPYSITNLCATIRKDRERLVEVKARAVRTAQVDASPSGVVIEGTAEYVRVTFAEKPAPSVLTALRGAQFRWAGGGWTGERAKLPPEVTELVAGGGLR